MLIDTTLSLELEERATGRADITEVAAPATEVEGGKADSEEEVTDDVESGNNAIGATPPEEHILSPVLNGVEID